MDVFGPGWRSLVHFPAWPEREDYFLFSYLDIVDLKGTALQAKLSNIQADKHRIEAVHQAKRPRTFTPYEVCWAPPKPGMPPCKLVDTRGDNLTAISWCNGTARVFFLIPACTLRKLLLKSWHGCTHWSRITWRGPLSVQEIGYDALCARATWRQTPWPQQPCRQSGTIFAQG